MAKKSKGRRSTRGHDESKTVRYRQVTTLIPVDRDGEPIKRKAQLPPSNKTAMADAFSSIEEQCKPPSVAIKENPAPKKAKAKVIGHIGKKQNPAQVPYKSKEERVKERTSLRAVTPVEKQCSLNYNASKEKEFYQKLSFKAKLGTVYVPEKELVARQQQRLKMLASGEHDPVKIKQRRIDKAKRMVALEHMQLMKEFPEDTHGLYHGSQGVSRDTSAAKMAEKYGDTLSTVHNNVVQTTTFPYLGLGKTGRNRSKSKDVLGIVQIASAARNDPSWVPDDATAGWYAHNVRPEDWPEDIIEHIQAYVESTDVPAVTDSGETYRRKVLINSFEQQIKNLEREVSYLKEEKALLSDENNFLMWEVCVQRGEYPYEAPPKGNTPTPSLPLLRTQLQNYMTLHRSDPVKNFLRVSGYNANDSELLKQYNGMRRAQLKSVKTEVAAIHRLGTNRKQGSLDYKRKKYEQYLSVLQHNHTRQQAVRDVGNLAKNTAVLRKWGANSTNKVEVNYRRVINKQYLFKPEQTTERTAYVRWWEQHEAQLTMNQLLTKPINRAANSVVKFGKKTKQLLLMEINPIARKRNRILQEEQAKIKAERKAKKIKARILRQQKQELKRRMNMVR